ncbi:MAG: hypothetical protein J6T84_05735 [Spirochaetaceae bacterium]|nr:hypothetical protein [Spirochaetaceae bacterium]
MRNKIYVTKKMPLAQQDQSCTIDVGKILSNAYKDNPTEFKEQVDFDSFYYFRQILDSIIAPDKTRIVFENFGILLEKDFALDVSRFLLEYAKDYQVFILQGPFKILDGNKLVWNIEKPENIIEFSQGVIETLNNE